MIRHVVALRFKPGTTEDEKAGIYRDLAALQGKIDGILDFQTRANVSIEEEMVRGFRDIFWFDFRNRAARDAYLPHPAHKTVGARLLAALEGGADGVFVMDFEL